MIMSEVITKQNGNIAFIEETHKYFDVTNPDAKFTSVTTMIHEYTQPFDKDFWSAYKALEKLLPKDVWNVEKKSLLNSKKFDKVLLDLHSISENDFNREQQGILDEWDNENRKSCDRGTKIHADLENSFYTKKNDISLSKFEIGGKFEEISEIISRVGHSEKLGVCLDTCHIFDGGYNIRENIELVLTEFDRIIGISKLRAIHLNDSLHGFESHKDRHEVIGGGSIGLDAMVKIINNPRLQNIPVFLETQNELDEYKEEIKILRENYNNN